MSLPPGVVSVVIPVYNEEGSLRELFAQIDAASKTLARSLEMIFVDDGSTDGGWPILLDLQLADSRVTLIRFRRNFGKASALAAGFAAAAGDWIVTMDADLQDDPAEIPGFLHAAAQNLDLVSGWKQVRHDPWHKRLPSRLFNTVVSAATGVRLHDHNCGFKCYRAAVVREIRLYGEFHRFTPALAAARGFRIGEMAVRHRPRRFGRSKYGWRRFLRGFLDLLTIQFLTVHGRRPQHLFGALALAFTTVGLVGIVFCFLSTSGGTESERRLFLLAALSLFLGLQALAAGVLAELIVANSAEERKPYSIAEIHAGRPHTSSV